MKLKLILFFCVFLTLVIGCAKPPLAEMDSARDAVFRAENDNDAVQYAGSTLARARDTLNRMQAEADSKRYDAARTLAVEAAEAAEKAITDGRAAAARGKDEAASLLSSLKAEIEETNRNISRARYSLLDLDYDSLDRDLRNAYDAADRAEADFNAGRYQDALNTARAVRADLFNINQKIANAVTRKK